MQPADNSKSVFPTEIEIPEKYRISEPVEQTEYLINGELRQWTGPHLDVFSPICVQRQNGLEQMRIGSCPSLTQAEAMEALDAAARAFDHGRGKWPTMSISERIAHIKDFVGRMKACKQEVVRLLMWEIGKSSSDSEKEFDRTIVYIEDTIDALKDLDRISSRFSIEQSIIGQIRRAPLGVVLCMGPFNYPLNETFTLLLPALIMGNTVVFKPPRFGVLLHRPLLEAFREALPPGVVNAVYGVGRDIAPPLMASGKIDALGFIGTSQAADSLKKSHPKPHRLRSILGLEAKNPAIILKDADLDLAVKECVLGSLSFNGQRCTALKILFVHSSIVDDFLSLFSQAVDGLKCGMPWEEGVNITPLPEKGKPQYLSDLVRNACDQGARVVNPTGGCTEATLYHPAIVYPVKKGMRLWDEEQFGPVVPVASFNDIGEPIRYIVESNYGQQVSIFGTNPDAIANLIDPLVNQVCRVNLNSQCQRGPDTFPFTGRKDSAESTLSVSDALRAFSIRTLVAAKENDINKTIITSIVRAHKSNFLSTDFIL